jgi:hypothetical protein
LLSLVLTLGMLVPATTAIADGQAGTTLTATVDVTPHWTITYGWTIDKSVTPDTWNLFVGDSGTSNYTITVTKDSGSEEAWVDGQVCVTNGGAVATENLVITAVLQDGYGSPNDFLTSASVDVSGNPVLDPGETGCYDYHVDIPITGGAFPQPHAGGTYKVTADVTITNHSGHLGELFGPSPSATTVFIASPIVVNDTINVDDTNGGSWAFNASGSVSYEKTFDCYDEGTNKNTATIRETGQFDSASVIVNCYGLEVSKTAETSFTRTYNWTIDKSADQSALTLALGEQFLVNYSVTVDATYTDSDFAAVGAVSIENPAPMAASLYAVADEIPEIATTLDLLWATDMEAGASVEGIWAADLPDTSDRTNTFTVTIQNYAYKWDGSSVPIGTTNFSDTADIDFSTAEMTEVDECIGVSDTYGGSLGTVCYGVDTLPKTFTYGRWIGPYGTCGDYTVENTASFVTNDTGATGSDSWTVNVHVPCAGGCTLTFGYWMTHSEFGPAPYDDTWAQLPNGASTPFFSSGQSYYQVLWTPSVGGNAYYILAKQYIAAKLNILNGAASTPAVDAAITWATSFFNTYTPAQAGALKPNSAIRSQAISYATTLANYNTGLIGPGHCSE